MFSRLTALVRHDDVSMPAEAKIVWNIGGASDDGSAGD